MMLAEVRAIYLSQDTRARTLSRSELDIDCRVLMAKGTGHTGDPRGRPEAGHNITECDNIARCHLTLFAVADL